MNLLLEDGDRLLDESGDTLLVEEDAAATEPSLSGRVLFPKLPPVRNTSRIVYITAAAPLGTVTAHIATRVEFADEELIQIV